MNTKPNDGGSILPAMQSNCGGHGIAPRCDGMTLRDYFAAAALQGIISSVFCTPEVTYKECADRAYGMADAMLAARES
jgi:hypothetical protein